MPTFGHDGPLDLLRKQPAQVPALLREALGLELPRFTTATASDSDFTQVRPASFYADLTVTLHGQDRRPMMGIVVELQLRRDVRKRRSWPLYTAELHSRLGCQTCLVVIVPDPGVARWASAPIHTLQPGSPFTPLVIGPGQIPRVTSERAHREPWMAVLSALAHGNSPGGVPIALAAIDAISGLPDERAMVCFDLICGSLGEAARRVLEHEMQHGKYEFKSDFARRYFGAGREEGLSAGRREGRSEGQLQMARTLLLAQIEQRFGRSAARARRAIERCTDLERLTALFARVSAAEDRQAVQALLASFAEGATPRASHRRARSRPAATDRRAAGRPPRARTRTRGRAAGK